jgi:hypothetical protein
MDAYYYSFTPTGNCHIDRILCAVASAGKAFHHTDCWQEETAFPYADCCGKTPMEWIQNAANDAAAAINREG